ncbi:MAG: hydrogenase maturation protease [Gemmatimonadota bacterium]|nr:hydrogenase maturation protease [Gemmatimonadota bacterium]
MASESWTASETPRRVLVACVGNIFFCDDGFGVEVARRLARTDLPLQVKVEDFGIRGMHLAYEMLDGRYDTTVLVDATPRGREPGTVYLIEPDLASLGDAPPTGGGDAHGMSPGAVFAMLGSLGGVPGRVLIVGCEPLSVEEGMGLSDVVARSVDAAVSLIMDVVGRECGAHSQARS